jgi:NAD(P)H-hydrate epimerase
MTKDGKSHDGAITSEQMYKIEETGHNIIGVRRVYMMENAGHGLADFISARFANKLSHKNIIAACGTGNNGGDGFVAMRHLAGCYDAKFTLILLGLPSKLRTEECRINWNIIQRINSITVIIAKEINEKITKEISEAEIIIDGVFGTGIKGPIKDPHASVIDLVNQSEAFVVAVDVPSGLDPNTGKVYDKCIEADATITFHRMKTGLLNNKKYTGDIYIEHIGIPKEAELGVIQ